eukprot:GHVS01105717.1.p1 GENE.GHVS01105717.1~~GHVS01105717.1.p1  ORF type:complete len:403 (-),score=43.32 GHVS01105717.1:1501-2709(-)
MMRVTARGIERKPDIKKNTFSQTVRSEGGGDRIVGAETAMGKASGWFGVLMAAGMLPAIASLMAPNVRNERSKDSMAVLPSMLWLSSGLSLLRAWQFWSPPLYLLCVSSLVLSLALLGFRDGVLLTFGILNQQLLFRICIHKARRVFSFSEAIVVTQLSVVTVCLSVLVVVANLKDKTLSAFAQESSALCLFWAPLVVALDGNICANALVEDVISSHGASKGRLPGGRTLCNIVLFPLAVLAWLAGTSIPDRHKQSTARSVAPIAWAFRFILAGKNHLIVVSCWVILVVVVVWFIANEASACHQQLSRRPHEVAPVVSSRWWKWRLTLCRKYFHALIVGVCVVAVALKTVELFVFATLAVLWLFIYAEIVRVSCPSSFVGKRLTPFLQLYGLSVLHESFLNC